MSVVDKLSHPSSKTSYLYQQDMADDPVFAVPEHPKITLLRCKLALLIGPKECPEYDNIKAQRPKALEEPWSPDMTGDIIHVGTYIVSCGWTQCAWH